MVRLKSNPDLGSVKTNWVLNYYSCILIIDAPDAEANAGEDTTVNVWEDNWDDDTKEDDFANQLR